MSQRQVLCIDDPMELGRSLGASFQGFERLCFEWRRAFDLLPLGSWGEQEPYGTGLDVWMSMVLVAKKKVKVSYNK